MGQYDELLALAEQIRLETQDYANDAERIGTMFKKIISYLPLIEGVKEVTQINTSLAKGVYIYTHTSSGTTYNDILFVTKSSNAAGLVDTHFLLFNKSQYSLQYRRNDEAFSDVFKYDGRTYFINDISDKDLQTFFRNIGYINMSDKYEANFIHTLDGIVYAGADVIENEITEEQKVSRFQIRLSGFGMYYRRLPYKDNPDTNFGSTPFIPLGHVNLGEIENEEYLDNVIELGIYSYIVTNGLYRRHKILFVTHSVSTLGSLNTVVQTKMESDISDSGEVILKRYTRTGQNNTIGQPDKYNWIEWIEDTGGITQEQKAIIDNLPISVMHDMEIEPEENQVNLRYTSKILSSGDDDVNQISIPAATITEAGVMSAEDKTKLDSLVDGVYRVDLAAIYQYQKKWTALEEKIFIGSFDELYYAITKGSAIVQKLQNPHNYDNPAIVVTQSVPDKNTIWLGILGRDNGDMFNGIGSPSKYGLSYWQMVLTKGSDGLVTCKEETGTYGGTFLNEYCINKGQFPLITDTPNAPTDSALVPSVIDVQYAFKDTKDLIDGKADKAIILGNPLLLTSDSTKKEIEAFLHFSKDYNFDEIINAVNDGTNVKFTLDYNNVLYPNNISADITDEIRQLTLNLIYTDDKGLAPYLNKCIAIVETISTKNLEVQIIDGENIIILSSDVVNNLNSDDTERPLSAAQGKVLNNTKAEKFITLLNIDSIQNNTSESDIIRKFNGHTFDEIIASANKDNLICFIDSIGAFRTLDYILVDDDTIYFYLIYSDDNTNFPKMFKILILNRTTGTIVPTVLEEGEFVLSGDVVDRLNSTDIAFPLSANQGRILNDKIAALEAAVAALQNK